MKLKGDQILPSAQQDTAVSCTTFLSYDAVKEGWLYQEGPGFGGFQSRKDKNPDDAMERCDQNPFLGYAALYGVFVARYIDYRGVRDVMMNLLRNEYTVSSSFQALLFM